MLSGQVQGINGNDTLNCPFSANVNWFHHLDNICRYYVFWSSLDSWQLKSALSFDLELKSRSGVSFSITWKSSPTSHVVKKERAGEPFSLLSVFTLLHVYYINTYLLTWPSLFLYWCWFLSLKTINLLLFVHCLARYLASINNWFLIATCLAEHLLSTYCMQAQLIFYCFFFLTNTISWYSHNSLRSGIINPTWSQKDKEIKFCSIIFCDQND